MPTYEYACKLCGHEFEIFQSIKDVSLRRCPKCKRLGLRRLISGGAGIIFKGTGFYETDYRRSPEKPKTESPAAKTDAPAEKKTTDTKPAAKTDPTPAKSTAPAAKPAASPKT